STAVLSSRSRVASMSPIRAGDPAHSRATAPETCGAAIEVPEPMAKPPPGNEERTSSPGALMSGFTEPSWPGPREENSATRLSTSCAPTEQLSVRLPGLPLVSHSGPLLPLDHTAKVPASIQACWMSSRNGSLDGVRLPHELL